MYMELYQVEDTHNTMNKEKTLVTSMNIHFKKQTNILRPYIKILYDGGIEMFNYAYIDELARYYFITNVEPFPNNIYYLQLEVDVLETYKADIMKINKVNYHNKVMTDLKIIESDYIPQAPSYIISTLGGVTDE